MIGLVLRLKDGFGSVYIAITMTANSSQICHFLQRVYCKFFDFWLQKIYCPGNGCWNLSADGESLACCCSTRLVIANLSRWWHLCWYATLLLARLMGQYCFAGWRLSSSSVVVCNTAGGRARGRSCGRHCTAGQYSYVPLGRHLVSSVLLTLFAGRVWAKDFGCCCIMCLTHVCRTAMYDISPWAVVYLQQPLWYTDCSPFVHCPLPTQLSTLYTMLKWVSAFRLSNSNKWRWWMWTVAAWASSFLTKAVVVMPARYYWDCYYYYIIFIVALCGSWDRK